MTGFDLKRSARGEMIHEGFEPDWPPEVLAQVSTLNGPSLSGEGDGLQDLRDLLWSSIDNDGSPDLDQIEFAERTPAGVRVLVGIADVDADLPIGSPSDQHAAQQATTVYTAVRVFPMLPERVSTDLKSLKENCDRLAVIIEMTIDDAGAIT
jgi:exoribonuclease-2